MSTSFRLSVLALVVMGAACKSPEPFDYSAYRDHFPTSILVLPPLDESPEVEATYAYLATVTRPLGELGYYVFPVAVVDRMMRENGLPTPYEMHSVSLAKLDEIFGADAVLYLRLYDWGTAYRVIDSSTEVSVEGRLVDVKSGTEIWRGQQTAVHSSSSGAGSLTQMLVNAVVFQIASSMSDPTSDVARRANDLLFGARKRGLLLGPHHPDFGEED